ncbi:hypothetical protein [Saccharothrix stipae]
MADFAGMLSRVATRRGLDARALAQAVGVPDTELTAVFGGAQPSASLLRRLAPVFGLHASDLFLVAGVTVPDDLAPAGRHTGVESLVWDLVYLPQVGRRVHELLRTMVGQAGTQPTGELEYDKWFMPGFGAVLLRLFGNRNMGVSAAVKVLYMLAGFGPWSASTLNIVGRGRKVPGDLVAASAVVLGIPAGDLAALAGVQLPEQARPTDPAASEASELIWEARSIPGPQMAQLVEQSHIIRHEYDDVVPPSLVCHCSLFHGPRTWTPPTTP